MALGCFFPKVRKWSYRRTMFQLQHVVAGGQVNSSAEVRLTISFHPPIIYKEHYFGTCILQGPKSCWCILESFNNNHLFCKAICQSWKASIVECLHLPWNGYFLWSSQLQEHLIFWHLLRFLWLWADRFLVVKKHQCMVHIWGGSQAYRWTSVQQRWESVNCTRTKETCIPWPHLEIVCEHCHMGKGPRSKEPNSTPSWISTMLWISVKNYIW